MKREFKIGIVLLSLVAALAVIVGDPASAQGGMNKATMKLLMGDLLEDGHSPTVDETSPGVFTVTVTMRGGQTPPTASQVNTFATNRSVSARVLAVRFQ